MSDPRTTPADPLDALLARLVASDDELVAEWAAALRDHGESAEPGPAKIAEEVST